MNVDFLIGIPAYNVHTDETIIRRNFAKLEFFSRKFSLFLALIMMTIFFATVFAKGEM